ncbi:DUF302 domain-containing protein [Nocardia terpenica]|uniref:AraC effector-binding domain-containing protein n=1 Tax=Nocardia terpenica TaxID=455432 RepID=A0A164NTE6_9NOCA|nr:DUF302 domain-containing protein [Nocardia terpenica]KZM74706.1 hypothetical protein AWN90_21860 [Nocardia terpenica]NQE93678.1 DUF302 domain-containing protein [Nocardia terpenica]
MEYRVSVCESIPQTVLQIPRGIRADHVSADIADGMRELTATARYAGLTACGAPTLTYHEQSGPDDAVPVEFAVPIDPGTGLGPRSGAEVIVTPGTLVARTCHRGGYDDIDTAYRALHEWLHASGYRPAGPPTEVYLIGPDEVADPRQLITEIRIPVTPSPALALHLPATFRTTERLIRKALREQGFVVSTSLDVEATLREHLGEHIDDYRVLGACHPHLMSQALRTDPQAGLLQPCAVVVRAVDTGTLIEAADPTVLIHTTGQTALTEIAERTRRLLATALETLRTVAYPN